MNSLRIRWASVLVMTLAGCGGRAELVGPRGSTSFDSVGDAGAEDPASVTGGGSASAGAPSTSGSGGRGAVPGGTNQGGAVTGGTNPGGAATGGMSRGGAPVGGMGQGGAVTGGTSPGGAATGGMSQGGAMAVGGRSGQGGMPGVEPDEPPPLPPGCTIASKSVSARCQYDFSCEDGDIHTACADLGGGRATCTCGGAKGQAALTINAAIDSACIIAATECRSPTTPVADGPTCEVVTEFGGVDDCYLAQECSNEVETSSGTVIRREPIVKTAECFASDGSWKCFCYDPERAEHPQIGVVLGGDLATRDACLRTSEVCDEEPFVFSEDRSCLVGVQSVEQDSCETDVACRRPGTSREGTPVHAWSNALVNCQEAGAETWSCECENPTDGDQMSISLPAADSSTACQQSVAECFEVEDLLED